MNTNATQAWRGKWMVTGLQETLKAALCAEKICAVDRTDSMYIWNPYGGAPTTVVQAIVGTYTPATYTTTNDSLTVTDEFVVSEQIHDFEKVMYQYDLFSARTNEMVASVATALDKWVLNSLLDKGTGAYATPSGGFDTPANIPVILSNLLSKVAGYAINYVGLGSSLYLVIEAADSVGFYQAGIASGFNFADSWLKNGWVDNVSGIDIYIKPNNTFVTDTIGTKSYTNSGHRVFGVKGISTYCSPRGIQYKEKDGISGLLGTEIVVWGYVGFAAWHNKLGLTVDITVTP